MRGQDLRSDVELYDLDVFLIGDGEEGFFDFFADDVLAESGNEVLDSAGDNDFVRIEGDELNGVADIVSPESCVIIND